MRIIALTLLLCVFGTSGLTAQNQIPGGDFENWAGNGLNLFEEPSNGWWATLNPLRNLGGPVSVAKSTDAHTGNYSAALTTEQYGTVLVPGILLSGNFDLLDAPNYFTRGQAYTSRPTTFRGWYKYSPADGDSAAIAVQLMRWNSLTATRDTVGEVGIIIRNAASTWTEFVLPITYFSNETPDSLIVVATSSADGGNFNGAVGSKLLVDDMDMDVATSRPAPQTPLDIHFQQQGRQLQFDLPREAAELSLFNASGQEVQRTSLHRGSQSVFTDQLPQGLYFLRASSPKGKVWQHKIVLL